MVLFWRSEQMRVYMHIGQSPDQFFAVVCTTSIKTSVKKIKDIQKMKNSLQTISDHISTIQLLCILATDIVVVIQCRHCQQVIKDDSAMALSLHSMQVGAGGQLALQLLRELAGKEPSRGVHPWVFWRGSCVGRSQQLGIWFGQLGPIDGSEEGEGEARAFSRRFDRFFKSRLKQGKMRRRGYHKEQNTITEDACLGPGFWQRNKRRKECMYKTEHKHW